VNALMVAEHQAAFGRRLVRRCEASVGFGGFVERQQLW
jgi:hypothetical protein